MEASSPFTLVTDPVCKDNVSKILFVHDGVPDANTHGNNLATFYAELGYHVVMLYIDDRKYQNVAAFIAPFEKFVRENKSSYVMGVAHYTPNVARTICMYCNKDTPKNALLMKHAFSCMYVHWGRERVSLICPNRCCNYNSSQLPKEQVEGMAVYYDANGDNFDARQICDELSQKIATLKLIASHKQETRHILGPRAPEEVEPKFQEKPLTSEQVVDVICRYFAENDKGLANSVALELGMSQMEWDEHQLRSGSQAVFLLLRRTLVVEKESLAFLTFANVLEMILPQEDVELSLMCRDFHNDKSAVLLSRYPSLARYGKDSAEDRGGAQFIGQSAAGNPSDGTHLDKVRSEIIPPFMREYMRGAELGGGGNNNNNNTTEQSGDKTDDFMRRVLEADAQYQRREIASGLVGVSSERGYLLSRKQGGVKPA